MSRKISLDVRDKTISNSVNSFAGKRSADPKTVFRDFLTKKRIFKDKELLSSSFVPNKIIHRDEEIDQLANILAPSLLLERISNVLVYGYSGTGKSLVTRYVAKQLGETAKEKEVEVVPLYINCRLENKDSEYRLIHNLCAAFGVQLPNTGLSAMTLYKELVKAIDNGDRYIILILDEIEKLIKKAGDGVLYSLLRLNESLDHAKISILGISNDSQLKASLDQRVKSSLSPVEIIFKPYNALQIADILKGRAEGAFYQKSVSDAIIQKCAALAAQENGDVRKALNLLRIAGETAQRRGSEEVGESDLDEANNILEQNITEEIVRSLPKQTKCVLLSIITIMKAKRFNKVSTGEVFDTYLKVAERHGLKKLTSRRVSELISDMDLNSLIMSRIKNNGRYGRTRELNIAFSTTIVDRIDNLLKEDLG